MNALAEIPLTIATGKGGEGVLMITHTTQVLPGEGWMTKIVLYVQDDLFVLALRVQGSGLFMNVNRCGVVYDT